MYVGMYCTYNIYSFYYMGVAVSKLNNAYN